MIEETLTIHSERLRTHAKAETSDIIHEENVAVDEVRMRWWWWFRQRRPMVVEEGKTFAPELSDGMIYY